METVGIEPTQDSSRRAEFTVYILRDADQIPLYVGQSTTSAYRLSQHRRRDWWPQVAHIELRRCSNKEQMDTLERELIVALDPEHNIAHKPEEPKDGGLRRCDDCLDWMCWEDPTDASSWSFDGDTLILGHWYCLTCDDLDTREPPEFAERVELPPALAEGIRSWDEAEDARALAVLGALQ